MLRRRRPVRGVTLIELVVTISVLALTLAAVGPSVAAWLRTTQIRTTAESIKAGLQRARAEAVRRNEPIRFSLVSLTDSAVMDDSCALSASGLSWVVSVNDPTSKCSQAVSDATDPMIVRKAAGGIGGNSVAVTALLADRTVAATGVTFDGFGRVADAASIGVIDIDDTTPSDDYRALRLVVSSGGTIRMCEPKVTSSSDPRHC